MRRALRLLLTILGAGLLTGATVHGLPLGGEPPSLDWPPSGTRTGTAAGTRDPLTHAGRGCEPAAAPNCQDGLQESGAKYRICTPTIAWNGDLLMYAHGYVAPDEPVEIPEDHMSLPGTGISVDQVATGLGYAFATTSYCTNGLAVLPAMSDLLDLVHVFTTTQKLIPDHIYLIGVSEGGLITVLSVEQHPEVYDGGLAMCGPYGDFRDQIDHYCDLRVVFDAFFPDLMLGEPFSIPSALKEAWQSGFVTETIQPAITDPAAAVSVTQLLTVTGVSPYAYAPPTSTDSIEKLLWYNVFAMDDAVAKLGGLPYDNHDRWYSGCNDDDWLNDEVARVSADPAALDEIAAHYQTSGRLGVPLITLHTTGDEGVPYQHATQYLCKTLAAGTSGLHEHLRVARHGHCNFTAGEVLEAFNTLVCMVEQRERMTIHLPLVLQTWPPDPDSFTRHAVSDGGGGMRTRTAQALATARPAQTDGRCRR